MSSAAEPLVMPPPQGLPLPARAAIGGISLALQTWGRVAPEAAGRWCWKMYFSPRRTPVPAREREALARATPHEIAYSPPATTPYPGGALKAWSWGEGPTVLFAHGWESRGAWLAHTYLDPLLSKGFRVVTMDMPGHGASPGEMSDVGHFAEAIKAAVAHFGPLHAVVAHSLGAAGTLLALDRGAAVGRVAAIGPAVWMLAFPARFCATFQPPERVREAMYNRLFETYAKEDWIGGSMDELAPKMSVPGLVVQDADDSELHPEGARIVSRRWPGARYVETRGYGHWKLVWAPEVVEQVVRFVVDGP